MWFRDKLSIASISLFLMLAVLPLVLGIGYALMYSFGLTGVLTEGFTFEYWVEVFSKSEMLSSFGFSLYIASVSMLIAVGTALFFSIIFNKELQKGIGSYMFYFPLSIPAMVAAFFIFQLFSKGGWVSSIGFQLGLIDSISAFPDLINDKYGIGIIAAHVLLAVPFFTIYFLNVFKTENLKELGELAITLGTKSKEISTKVYIPILFSRSLPTLVLYYIFILGSYEIPLLLGRESSEMVSVLAIRKLRRFNLNDIPEAYIIALVYIVIVLSCILLLFRKRRISYDI